MSDVSTTPGEDFRPTHDRGFLPAEDPLPRLPSEFGPWEELAAELPKLLATMRIRSFLDHAPNFDMSLLQTEAEFERAMLILSYFGHAYVWGQVQPAYRLPAALARPWYQVAQKLGRPPVLSYASYALQNWRRVDHSPTFSTSRGAIMAIASAPGTWWKHSRR